ncbi:MAG TPA: hypothetical protein DHW02_00920 [Ktedonobacter sp.]|nr:hypothetical protein [Ktedonobacter sp.]
MRQIEPSDRHASSQSQLSQPYNVLIDTDIGDDIDDAFALAVALHSPELILRGVSTVFGDTQRRAQLARYLLHVFGHDDIPVSAGASTPLVPRRPHAQPSGVAQASILEKRNIDVASITLDVRSGAELIIDMARAYYGQLTLICIGPLTNIALALLIEPDLPTAIRNIVMMGGSSSIALPEWNIRNDVKAAEIVLTSGIPVTLIGMNITLRCSMRRRDIEELSTCDTPETHLLTSLIDIWRQHRPRWHPPLPYLHDPLTVAALCNPSLLRFRAVPVHVMTQGLFKGFTVPHVMGGTVVNAAVDVRVREAREWIMKRLLM